MRLLCLMPTYGRRKELLQNSIACFQQQDHKDKILLIYDDLGTLQKTGIVGQDIFIMSSNTREPDVGTKYNVMCRFAVSMGYQFDAAVVWDDDDVYLPKHLSTHATILRNNRWSKPSTIVSAYHNPPQEEAGNGRFHGSIAAHRLFLEEVGGWVETTRATFDQEMLSKLGDIVKPGDPCTLAPPQYVYRWQTTKSGHCSGLMGNPDWYALYKPDSTQPIDTLFGQYDADTLRIQAQLLQPV